MRSGFCYNGNKLNNLLISTPTADQANSGYWVQSSEFDSMEYCIGFRFRLTSILEKSQTIIQSIDTSAGTVCFSFYIAEDFLKFTNKENSFKVFAVDDDTWYYFYAYVGEESMTVYLYNMTTNATLSDTFVLNAHYPANSKIFFLNNFNGDDAIHGTMCDFMFESGGADLFEIYKSGGYRFGQYQIHCPMREGSGSTCRFLGRTDLVLQAGGTVVAPTWAVFEGTDVGRRWV